MTDWMIVIRFPDGDAELQAAPEVPAVGARISTRGTNWLVAHVDAADGRVAVTVMPTEVVRDDSWPKPYEFVRAY